MTGGAECANDNDTENAIRRDPSIHPDLVDDLIKIYRSYVKSSQKLFASEQ